MAIQSLPESGTGVVRALTINRPREEVYAFWRDFKNFPLFMRHIESITVLDAKRSHWVAKAPGGTTVEWDAEITSDEPGSLISWQSVGNADIDNAGSVHFSDAPGNRGTELLVELTYEAPGGALGRGIAKLFGKEPKLQVREDMRRFKALIESGVIPTIIGQSTGEGRYKEDA